jgi:hypothetical protein
MCVHTQCDSVVRVICMGDKVGSVPACSWVKL